MRTLYEKIHKYKDDLLNEKVNFSSTKDTKIFPSTNQIIKNSVYVIIGKAVSYLASFTVVMIMGKLIPRETVGSYNYVIAILTIVSITTLPGMNTALARSISKGYEGTLHYMLHKRLLWGLAGSFICLFIGIISWINGDTILGIAFLVATPFVPLTDTFSDFAVKFWEGKKRFDKSSTMGLIYYLGLAILSILVLILSDNLIVMIGGIMIAQAIIGYIVYIPIRKNSGEIDKDSYKLGLHLTAIQIFSTISSNIDRVIVWYLLGPVTVAIYSFATIPISKTYRLIPIGIISLPHLSNQTFTKTVKNMVIRKTLMLFVITIPITIFIVLIAPFIYKIFFPLYPESVAYFKLVAVSLIFSPILLVKTALMAFNKTRALYINSIVTPIVKIILMILLTAIWGLWGMIIGIVIATAFEFILVLIIFLKLKTITENQP